MPIDEVADDTIPQTPCEGCRGGVPDEADRESAPMMRAREAANKAAREAAKNLAMRVITLRDRDGKDYKGIAESLGMPSSEIARYLNYGRFISRSSAPPDLGIKDFALYWSQVAGDKYIGCKARDPEFDERCFREIETMFRAGQKPRRRVKVVKKRDAADIKSMAQLKEQIVLLMDELETDLARQQRLLGADRSTYAPSVLGGWAVAMARKCKAIKILAARIGDLDEPAAPAR